MTAGTLVYQDSASTTRGTIRWWQCADCKTLYVSAANGHRPTLNRWELDACPACRPDEHSIPADPDSIAARNESPPADHQLELF